jgi:hypothetical protein
MLARDFPTLWCDWMDIVFSSSCSAIMLNGVPGKWIHCMRGLRQGDPLSPYLFLIIADVLQRLIKLDAGILHPLADGVPCPVLQYADDTLIIMRADAGAARRLRLILQQFEQATGLRINYHKSTLVPMHVAPEHLSDIQDCLQCRIEGFPQTYLGLPLSAQKLRLDAFAPLIAKVDKYLSGWRSLLLSPGGRLVLLNSVLDALPAYAMGAIELPAGLLDALDKLRRSFLWAPADRASGAKCHVAWDLVCRPKEEGGLGVHDLRIQNKCLQMRLIHRLHSVPGASWPRWVWSCLDGLPIDYAAQTSSLSGSHWAALVRLLPVYRCLSKVVIGDGARASFWFDRWIGDVPLDVSMPELFTHSSLQCATVRQVFSAGLDAILVPRFSPVAARQRNLLLPMLAAVRLTGEADSRSLRLCDRGGWSD